MSCITPSYIICISPIIFTSGFKAFRRDHKELARTQCARLVSVPDTWNFAMYNSDYSSMANENLFLPVYKIPHYTAGNSPAEAYECHP